MDLKESPLPLGMLVNHSAQKILTAVSVLAEVRPIQAVVQSLCIRLSHAENDSLDQVGANHVVVAIAIEIIGAVRAVGRSARREARCVHELNRGVRADFHAKRLVKTTLCQ